MIQILKHSVVAATLALGMGAVQAYPLETRVMGCTEIVPVLNAAFAARTSDIPADVAFEALVGIEELHPAQRYIVAVILGTLYELDSEHIPDFEHYRMLTFHICLDTLGEGEVELEGEKEPAGLSI